MKVLIGTTNPSKVKWIADILEGCDAEFVTLKDLGITGEPDEHGNTPEENAVLKAEFYARHFDVVVCNDSGLYFDSLKLDDPRQPGLNIRTPGGCERLDDEAMIEYYSELIASLGGKVTAFYLNGIAVYNKGQIYSFMEDRKATGNEGFFMVDKPSEKRHPGWPLDSLSQYRDTLMYFSEREGKAGEKPRREASENGFKQQVRAFLRGALGV